MFGTVSVFSRIIVQMMHSCGILYCTIILQLLTYTCHYYTANVHDVGSRYIVRSAVYG